MGDPIGGSDPTGLADANSTAPGVDSTAANAPTFFDSTGDGLHGVINDLNSNPYINAARKLNNDLGSTDPLQMLVGADDQFDYSINGAYGLAMGKGNTLDNSIAVGSGLLQIALLWLDDGRSPGCFIAGTPVHMADGSSTTIENVHDGDKVISRDPVTGKTEIKTVLNTTVHQVHDLVILHFAGKKHGREIDSVTATPVHPFYVKGIGFVPAGQLAVGNNIVTRAGPNVVIVKIEDVHLEKSVPVYNLTVSDDHTYFVRVHAWCFSWGHFGSFVVEWPDLVY